MTGRAIRKCHSFWYAAGLAAGAFLLFLLFPTRAPAARLLPSDLEYLGVFRSASGLWAARSLTRIYYGQTLDIPVAR